MTAAVVERAVLEAVREGLARPEKALPPWLLYDDEGSRLFERITALPDYYLTRAERLLLLDHADTIAGAFAAREVVELGAGTATKSELLLTAMGRVRFVPVDVSPEPLALAAARLAKLPGVRVTPVVGTNAAALGRLAYDPERLVLFLGSSLGNLDDAEAVALLREVRRVAGGLLLGADLRKPAATLLAAYDDPVTEAFIRNVLTRINRELGADFDQGAMRYVVVWNPLASRLEMYLESQRAQVVQIRALGATVALRAGERIHVENSRKFELTDLDALFGEAGFRRVRTWVAAADAFVLTLAR